MIIVYDSCVSNRVGLHYGKLVGFTCLYYDMRVRLTWQTYTKIATVDSSNIRSIWFSKSVNVKCNKFTNYSFTYRKIYILASELSILYEYL